MYTVSAKPESVKRNWYLVDLAKTDLSMGRVASRIASILRGKNKPEFTPHVDTGDYVIVINADKAKVTGRKADDKIYYRHTQYPGGIKQMNFKQLMEKFPDRAISYAVKGMLPKNPLGRAMFSKLKVYAGSEHPHVAQQAETIQVLA